MTPARSAGHGTSASAAREARLRELLEPVVGAAGYDLDAVSLSSAGRRTLVRVTVDADGGIDLDAVAQVSRTVSDLLDGADDVLPGPFVLEVSSPGVDRPLSEPRYWRRAVGRLVEVPVGPDQRRITARVTAVDADGVRLAADGQQSAYPWADLGTGHVQVEFAHAAEGADADAEADSDADADVDDELDAEGDD